MIKDVIESINQIVNLFVEHKEQQQRQIESLTEYLLSLASCLDEMVEHLEKNEVPTEANNKLSKAFLYFEEVIGKANLDEVEQSEFKYAQNRIRKNLDDGMFLEDVIKGYILYSSETVKRERFKEMTRLAGYLNGVVDTLKATLL